MQNEQINFLLIFKITDESNITEALLVILKARKHQRLRVMGFVLVNVVVLRVRSRVEPVRCENEFVFGRKTEKQYTVPTLLSSLCHHQLLSPCSLFRAAISDFFRAVRSYASNLDPRRLESSYCFHDIFVNVLHMKSQFTLPS